MARSKKIRKQPRYRSNKERMTARVDAAVALARSVAAQIDPAVAELAVLFLRGYGNPGTACARGSALVRYFTWCLTAKLHPFHVRKSHGQIYFASLAELAPGTAAGYVTTARRFYRLAMAEELIEIDPFSLVEVENRTPQVETPAFTQDELEAVLQPLADRVTAGAATLTEHRDYALIWTASRSMARSMSLRELTWSGWQPNPAGGKLSFIQKGRRPHSVQLSQLDADVLGSWHDRLGQALGRPVRPDDPMFPGLRGRTRDIAAGGRLEHLTANGIRAAVKTRYLAAGFSGPRLAVHALRASGATIAHENQKTDGQIQSTGGWKSPAMVALYIKRRSAESATEGWDLGVRTRRVA